MKNLCDRLAGLIVRESAREDADIEVISYGLQGILGTAAEVGLIILSGIVLGMLKEILVMSAAFVTVRLMAGGVHFSTYNRCLASSVLIFVSAGLMVRLVALLPGFAETLYLAFGSLFTSYCIYRYSPRDNPNRLIREEELPKFRRASIITVGLMLAAVWADYLTKGTAEWYHYSLVTGLSLESFTLTDSGYLLVKYIENKLNEGGGVRNEKS
ncbi:MAG: accessory gene regulator B family protein [Clostridiales bacterium]|jgi:accessory gene regulator B|nr:accessory gene regulator B family protein [Clostridiales bacterium]